MADAGAQVFVVGAKSATADIDTSFTPTSLPLPTTELGERGRRDLVRNLEAEQGFAHRALPMGAPGLTLVANGAMSPSPDKYKEMIYTKGQSAAPGDRVAITALAFKPDRIIIDVNGGPYVKHRFLRHIQLNDADVVADTGEVAVGTRITLVFPGKVPDISAPEVKALLTPILDFGVKTTEEAYADTLPAPVKDAIASHDVLVGMNHRMVLAALGAPEHKVREDNNEEWIYGHVPQTVKFIRFKGDRVSLVKIAAVGKPLEIHDKDEMAGYLPPVPTREVAMGDGPQGAQTDGSTQAPPPPTLRKPGEAAPPSADGKVQDPTSHSNRPIPPPPGTGPASGDPSSANPSLSNPNSNPSLSNPSSANPGRTNPSLPPNPAQPPF